MVKMYLVTYRDFGSVEGFVRRKGDFDKWLAKRNRRRREEGEIREDKGEFDIDEIWELGDLENE